MADEKPTFANNTLVWDIAEHRVKCQQNSQQVHVASDTLVKGSCHCGSVSFNVQISPAPLTAHDCNCSICRKKGYLHLIIPKERVLITSQAWANTTTYTFNTGVATHTFCTTCGVQAIYQPRSNPDCYSVNVRCLDLEAGSVPIYSYDGKNFAGPLHVK